MFLNLVLLIVGLGILIAGGESLVRGSTNIAYKLKLTPLVVGLTIVAFGTSAPELIVSLNSALNGNFGIAIGNVVGSNICNLTLVLGATAMFCPIIVSENSIKLDWIITFGSSLLLFFFVSSDGILNHFEGVILFLILVIYTYFLLETSRRQNIIKEESGEVEEINEEVKEALKSKTIVEVGFILLGCAGLFLGGKLFVDAAVEIAEDFNLDESIIGLTVVAFGTSAPELVTSIIAAARKNTDLALGNLLGSCIFNVLSILGITSIIQNITVTEEIRRFDMLVMLGIILLVLPMMITRKKIAKFEGLVLFTVYIAYTGFKIYEIMSISSISN